MIKRHNCVTVIFFILISLLAWGAFAFSGVSVFFNTQPKRLTIVERERSALSKEMLKFKRIYIQADSVIDVSGSTKLCPGTAVTLRANPTPAGAAYQWLKNDTPIPGANLSSYIANTAGTYYVKVTTAGTTSNYQPVTLTTVTAPVASFTNTADNLCSSSPIRFTNTSTGNGLTYLWNFGDPNSAGNNTATTANPIHKFVGNSGIGNQTYQVTLTVTNSDGCSSTVTKTVTMKQRPGTELSGPDKVTINGDVYFRGCSNTPQVMTFGNISATKTDNLGYVIKWGITVRTLSAVIVLRQPRISTE